MLVDLKVRKCRGCDKLMVEVVRDYHFTYCDACHKKYDRMMGQYDN